MRRLILSIVLLQTVSLIAAAKPRSLFATTLTPCASNGLEHCHSVWSSHNGKTVALRLAPRLEGGGLTVQTGRGQVFDLLGDGYWNLLGGVDVLWSPNSTFIAITGGINGYTESARVFEVTSAGARVLNVFHEVTADMLKSFPPCESVGMDREDCELQERDPFYNYAAIAWSDPNTLVVMSEIPCSSLWGSFMCQVVGYEIDVRTGHIVRRMNARQFKARWQHAMAWNFRIPESPESLTSAHQGR